MSVTITEWNGDKIKKRLDEAQRLGIDTTTAICDTKTKRLLNKSNGSGRQYRKGQSKAFYRASAPGEPPAKPTGALQGSISSRPAQRSGKGWRGEWGSYNNGYALWLEIGTWKMAPRPYLRPTATEEYPKLAGRIKKFFERGG